MQLGSDVLIYLNEKILKNKDLCVDGPKIWQLLREILFYHFVLPFDLLIVLFNLSASDFCFRLFSYIL